MRLRPFYRVIACGVLMLLGAPARSADVRDFAPDRPSRSDSPITVPDGYFQIESDFANYTPAGQQLQAFDPLLKYGVGNRMDIEVQIGGFEAQRNAGVRTEGFGDVAVRAKINLLGDDGGAVAWALIPYMKIPTARPPLGDGQVEGGLNAPVLISLPYDMGLTLEPEASVLKNNLNDGKQASFTGVANLGRKIVGDLSGFVEVYGQAYTDGRTPGPTLTFDTGVSYLVTKTVQLDLGVNVGLNHNTPGLNIYSGVAARF